MKATTLILSALGTTHTARTSALVEATGLTRAAVLKACRSLEGRGFAFKADVECDGTEQQRVHGRYIDALWQINLEPRTAAFENPALVEILLDKRGNGHDLMCANGFGC